MKIAKKVSALLLTAVLVLGTFTGCHKKGEIAVTVGGYEYTSGYYACALMFADMQARSLVEEELSKEGDLPEDIDYLEHKVEDTKYDEWVKKEALKNVKTMAAHKNLCAENKITLDEETISNADEYSEYLWTNYGYSLLLEPNGVGKDTFFQYNRDAYYTDKYFEFLYGEGGEKEIATDKLKEKLDKNYVLVNMMQIDFTELTDAQKNDATETFVAYEAQLKLGKKTFEEIYSEQNDTEENKHTHEEPKEGELAPKDPHASILGNEETDYASEHFETAKKLEVGDVKLIELEENAGLVLIVKQDILADPYYIDYLDMTLRTEVAGDKFTEEVEKYAEKLAIEVNKYAINQFKVKNIQYPEGY